VGDPAIPTPRRDRRTLPQAQYHQYQYPIDEEKGMLSFRKEAPDGMPEIGVELKPEGEWWVIGSKEVSYFHLGV